ncbi:MAG TPA: sensor histidine kinase [Ktedonobacteraceae bacterium]
MKRIFPRRTLKWQLSLSYILLMMMIVPLLLVVGVAWIALTPRLTPGQQLVWILRAQTAPQVTHEVQLIHDPVGLNKWSLNLLGDPEKMGWNALTTVGIMILDRNGRRIVPTDWQLIKPVESLFSRPAGQSIIHAAFANAQNLTDLTFTFDNGQTAAAVPLLDTQGHILGIFGAVVTGLTDSTTVPANPTFGFFWGLFTGNQPYNATSLFAIVRLILLLTLIMGSIGIVFGGIMGRRITRRLQFITAAIHEWSQGQFQTIVNDHSTDELGQLAQDFNQMARQVQTLLAAQQRLTLLEERQRMARNLHDSVKQQTFGMTLLIGAGKKYLERDPARACLYLTEAEALATQTRQELTALIQELRPLALTEKGFTTVLQEYSVQWSRHTGIVVETSLQETSSLSPEQEENVFRVAQEALTNVVRHSKANRVSVRLLQETEQVCLIIRDNGQGFDVVKAIGKGLGLTTMRERIEAYQGTVSISSTNEGTIVEIRIPCIENNHPSRSSKEIICE